MISSVSGRYREALSHVQVPQVLRFAHLVDIGSAVLVIIDSPVFGPYLSQFKSKLCIKYTVRKVVMGSLLSLTFEDF